MWFTLVDSILESDTLGYPLRWALTVNAGPRPAEAFVGAHILAVTAIGESAGHGLQLLMSLGSLRGG